jgi:hypothetical protein
MTDVGRMSVTELVGKVVADEHADVLRQAVVWLAQELMEAGVTAAAGAGYGERAPDRVARRNGYRKRAWDTRVGSIELAIPKLRQGSYFPSFPESPPPLRAGPGRSCPGGLRQRDVKRQQPPVGGPRVVAAVGELRASVFERFATVTPRPPTPLVWVSGSHWFCARPSCIAVPSGSRTARVAAPRSRSSCLDQPADPLSRILLPQP